jgi:hypothetical protein
MGSFMIHAQGALRTCPNFWNALPNNIDQNPARLWDWGERELETSSRACSAHKRRPSNCSVSEEPKFGRPPRRLPLPARMANVRTWQ